MTPKSIAVSRDQKPLEKRLRIHGTPKNHPTG